MDIEDTFPETFIATSDLRIGLFRASMARVVLGVLLMGSFWAAYSWIIVCVFLTLTLGAIGGTHFSTIESLYHSQCCCAPRPAVLFLYYATIVNVPLTVISIVSSFFAALYNSGVDRVLSIVALVLCVVLCGVETYFWIRCKTLRDRLDDDQFGFGTNQVAPEVMGTVSGRQPGSRGNSLPGGGGGPFDNRQPIVFGYPIHQEVHVSVQPSPFTANGRRASMSHQQEDPTCIDAWGSARAETPPDFVTTRDTLGYSARREAV